jgi:hypothetical protein
MGSEILLEDAEVETVFDLNDPFVQRTSCTEVDTIHGSEQSGVADRRNADDRLRGVCYSTCQAIFTKTGKNIDTIRFSPPFLQSTIVVR